MATYLTIAGVCWLVWTLNLVPQLVKDILELASAVVIYAAWASLPYVCLAGLIILLA